jgi:hypothetical protein
LTKSHKPRPNTAKPLAGGVRHDARGNAVWQWATETARHAVASTSQLLRRLDVSSLSLEDDAAPPKAHSQSAPTKPAQTKSAQTKPVSPLGGVKPGAPARKADGGFNPYDGAALPAAAALAKKRPAAQARVRSSWWRRLFQRR